MIIECPLEAPDGTLLGKIRISEDGTFEGFLSTTTSFARNFGDVARAGMANAIVLQPKLIPAEPAVKNTQVKPAGERVKAINAIERPLVEKVKNILIEEGFDEENALEAAWNMINGSDHVHYWAESKLAAQSNGDKRTV